MQKTPRPMILVGFVVLLVGLTACATPPPGQYRVMENPTYQYTPTPDSSYSGGYISLNPEDRFYVLQVNDQTPFGVRDLPRTDDVLFNKGYDKVRRERKADFAIDVGLTAMHAENPERRAGQTVGGALLGAAAGAAIGGALGDPGQGAAIGAASGGVLGFAAPAGTTLVRIDLRVYSYSEGRDYNKSATIDLASVPPQDVHVVIDNEVSRMLQGLPNK